MTSIVTGIKEYLAVDLQQLFHEVNNSLALCFETDCPLQPCLLDHAKTKGLINLHKKIRNISLYRPSNHVSFSVSYYMCIANLILSL